MDKNTLKIQLVAMHKDILICCLLVIVTLPVYWQVTGHEFLNFDDDVYVTENEHVLDGLNKGNIAWAFSFDKRGTYWHPLTWLSHMLDSHLFGLNSSLHHLTNLLFHIANTLLLFFVLSRMTGALWRSAFVAALFALHPVNVDSVAWLAERKNLLSTFFWMLTMLTYIYYAARPGVLRYLLTILFFTLGLLAKPMLVTLPFVLILMDWWPLGRLRLMGKKASGTNESRFVEYGPSRLIIEKLPLLVLSIFSIVVSSLSLQKASVILATKYVPMDLRIANAIVSYVKYIGKMVWPHDLAVYYPFPSKMFPLWQMTGAVLLLVLVSVFALYLWRRRSYFTVSRNLGACYRHYTGRAVALHGRPLDIRPVYRSFYYHRLGYPRAAVTMAIQNDRTLDIISCCYYNPHGNHMGTARILEKQYYPV